MQFARCASPTCCLATTAQPELSQMHCSTTIYQHLVKSFLAVSLQRKTTQCVTSLLKDDLKDSILLCLSPLILITSTIFYKLHIVAVPSIY